MGVFTVPVTLRRWQNGVSALTVEHIACDAYVDSGALRLALPTELVQRLNLSLLGRVRARTADGASHDYRLVGMVQVEVQGRSCVVDAVELPSGAPTLLGAIPLEMMDWHISPAQQKLLPNPESPDMPQVWLLSVIP
jgi:hypothetical protein